MPALPWTQPNTPEPGTEAVVMASRLEVRSLLQVPGFFLASMAVWRQARRSPGAYGLSLKADLLSRTFWTVSVWHDKAAIHAYAAAEPHRSTMRRKRAVMKESTFIFWNAAADGKPIGWDEVERRIAEERTR
ncbi:DUF3291 domain-containing protein [Nonomuraea sp. NPDC050536]|uniref:DUF3291 domain-containing protein n=1 Tax=Nonomuraea sp. NPDC050536 TaxID=3364366 RepID=UPI0037C9A414